MILYIHFDLRANLVEIAPEKEVYTIEDMMYESELGKDEVCREHLYKNNKWNIQNPSTKIIKALQNAGIEFMNHRLIMGAGQGVIFRES